MACFQPGEQVFELYHAGIGEHQCRVILGYKRTGGDNLVTMAGKILQKGRPDILGATHYTVPVFCLQSATCKMSRYNNQPAHTEKCCLRHLPCPSHGITDHVRVVMPDNAARQGPFLRGRGQFCPAPDWWRCGGHQKAKARRCMTRAGLYLFTATGLLRQGYCHGAIMAGRGTIR